MIDDLQTPKHKTNHLNTEDAFPLVRNKLVAYTGHSANNVPENKAFIPSFLKIGRCSESSHFGKPVSIMSLKAAPTDRVGSGIKLYLQKKSDEEKGQTPL
jgi:hypothetical protein